MHARLLFLGAAVAFATSLPAQSSPLTTTYQSNNNSSIGGGVYFDLDVHVPVTIDKIDINVLTAGLGGTVELWTIPGGHTATNITSSTGWTMQGSGTAVSAGTGLPTPVVFTDSAGNPTPFTLAPGLYGVAICTPSFQQVYTNGTGTNEIYSNSEMTLIAGSSQNAYFSATTVFSPRVFNGSIYYTVPTGWALWQLYGAGCPDTSASFYEVFGPGSFDLAGTATTENVFQMIFTGSDYIATPAAPGWFAPTSTPLILADDANSAPQPLPFTLSFPGGSASSVIVGSNGYIYLGTNTSWSPGAYYWPTAGIPVFLSAGPRHAPFWGDLDPSVGGAVYFDVDPSGNAAYVTWVGVPEFGAATATATFQLCIQSGGTIEYRYRGCTIAAAPALTGWSPGGGVRDPGPIDVSAALMTGFITGQDASPITLGCNGRPVIGQTMNIEIGDIPANTVLGILFLSAGRTTAPGLSLTNAFGGMEGCFQHVMTPLATAAVLVAPGSTASVPLSIPGSTGLAGSLFYCQAAAAINPPAFTSSGLISSNAARLWLENM